VEAGRGKWPCRRFRALNLGRIILAKDIKCLYTTRRAAGLLGGHPNGEGNHCSSRIRDFALPL
jgi:hypothetical protein